MAVVCPQRRRLKTLGSSHREHNPVFPVLDVEGNVYVGAQRGTLRLRPEGRLKWQYRTGGRIESAPVVCADGTVTVCSYDQCVYTVGRDGKLRWRTWVENLNAASPLILKDGRIYVGAYHRFVALQGTAGPASAPWSMLQANPQRTGRFGR